jgi:hypothetical protein
MNIMFNDFDRSFELLNLRYKHEIREILCFAKHHSLSLSLSLYIYIYIYRVHVEYILFALFKRIHYFRVIHLYYIRIIELKLHRIIYKKYIFFSYYAIKNKSATHLLARFNRRGYIILVGLSMDPRQGSVR